MYHLKRYTLLCVCFLLAQNLIAKETPIVKNIIRTPLLTAHLTPEKSVERVEIKQLKFSPMQATGLHLHPCPVVGYIAKGSIYFQVEGEKPTTLKTGDAFYEPANVKILHFDNVSKTEGASFIAFYLLDKADKEIIRMLE